MLVASLFHCLKCIFGDLFHCVVHYRISTVFNALDGMQKRSSDENSVCPSVCPTNACIVTKLKKDLYRFLYHTKDHLASFLRRRMVGGERPILREILGQPAPVGAKSPILNRYSLVAPEP